jgi:hypothetical protein
MGKTKREPMESEADRIRRDGPTYTIGDLNARTLYRVEGTYNLPDRSGSKSFAATYSPSAAIADLAQLKADPANAHITAWDILVFDPATKITVLEPADYEFAVLEQQVRDAQASKRLAP